MPRWQLCAPDSLPDPLDQGQLAPRACPVAVRPSPLLSNRDCGISTADRAPRPETLMAEHNEVAYTTADGNDYPAHEQTYEGFIMLVKYGSAAVIFIVAMMAIFLT
jgi:hypothetical protein